MIEIVKTNDYKDFTNLLIQEYKDKEKFLAWQEAFAAECNKLETAIFELMEEYNIDHGMGIQLDIIGNILGLPRYGRNDESYKTILKIKAEINSSSGTPEAIIKTAEKLYNATDVQLVFIYPAKIQLWQNGDIGIFLDYNLELDIPGDLMELDDGGILQVYQADDISEDLINQVIPSGVGLILTYNLILDDGGFLELDDGGIMIVA